MRACKEWKALLADFALGDTETRHGGETQKLRLEAHLKDCSGCSSGVSELRARAARMDRAMREMAGTASPSAGFDARLMARIETSRGARWWSGWLGDPRVRMRFAATGVICAAILAATVGPRVYTAMFGGRVTEPTVTISTWQSPTDSLLQTPGREILNKSPKLVEVYFPLKPKTKRLNK